MRRECASGAASAEAPTTVATPRPTARTPATEWNRDDTFLAARSSAALARRVHERAGVMCLAEETVPWPAPFKKS
jgi:hypothetical protein